MTRGPDVRDALARMSATSAPATCSPVRAVLVVSVLAACVFLVVSYQSADTVPVAVESPAPHVHLQPSGGDGVALPTWTVPVPSSMPAGGAARFDGPQAGASHTWSWMSVPSSTRNGDQGPWMDPLEVASVRMLLDPALSFLEYGSGRSTRYFSKFIGRYTAIDDSDKWCGAVANDLRDDGLTHVELACVPTDVPIAEYKAKRATEAAAWKSYAHHIQHCCQAFDAATVDILLNDGSARGIINGVALDMVGRNTLFVLHDYARDHAAYPRLSRETEMVLRTFVSIQPGGGQIAVRRPLRTHNGSDDLFGTGDYGRGAKSQSPAAADVVAATPAAPGWNVFSVASHLRCLAGTCVRA